ncbi:MAG: hypothetical protein CMJ77_18865 [Planctomycetaceae bacterium]|nr:hypothetical protein [Planctomycetaceae bacterium]
MVHGLHARRQTNPVEVCAKFGSVRMKLQPQGTSYLQHIPVIRPTGSEKNQVPFTEIARFSRIYPWAKDTLVV